MTTYRIGRLADCDIVINDATVSRHHAEIAISDGGQIVLTDIGSTGGTYVRGKTGWRPIQQSSVTLIDEVRFGSWESSIQLLLNQLRTKKGGRVRLERDPDTGEIVTRFE